MTFTEFAEKHSGILKFDAIQSYIDKDGRRFYCVRINGKSFDYNQGSGIKHEPRPDDVLCCLAGDIRSLENSSSFEDWAADFGYDSDSRKAFGIYESIKHENTRLVEALGEDLVRELLNCEEE